MFPNKSIEQLSKQMLLLKTMNPSHCFSILNLLNFCFRGFAHVLKCHQGMNVNDPEKIWRPLLCV